MKLTDINLDIHIRYRNERFVTPERIQLLRMVKSTGSLNAAAKHLSMSYQTAWKIIDANKKYKARVEAMEYILSKIPYDDKNKRILKHQNLEEEN